MRRADDQAIMAEYENWDPGLETVDEFVVRIGTTKPTLYAILKRNDIQPKLRRGTRSVNANPLPDILAGRMAEHAIRSMLDEITTLAARVAELEAENERLRKRIARRADGVR